MLAAWALTIFPAHENTLFRWTDLQAKLHQGYLTEGFTAAEIALTLGIRALAPGF